MRGGRLVFREETHFVEWPPDRKAHSAMIRSPTGTASKAQGVMPYDGAMVHCRMLNRREVLRALPLPAV